MNWAKFKEENGIMWDWSLPNDSLHKTLQKNNREKMEKIWDKFGRGILNYHASKGVNITYAPYPSAKNIFRIFETTKYYICFVIDGTGPQLTMINRNIRYVWYLIDLYKQYGHSAEFKIVVYRDHFYGKKTIEQFPVDSKFTADLAELKKLLHEIKVDGRGHAPNAVLDGLATAATGCDWKCAYAIGVRNRIIHFLDAPPYVDCHYYQMHSYTSDKAFCCEFNWERDVWDVMKQFKIEYHGFSPRGNFTKFENEMKAKLGILFQNYHWSEEKEACDPLLSIFIDN